MPQPNTAQIVIADIVSGLSLREHYDEEAMLGLTQSMRESGQQDSIHVTALGGGKYSLVGGSRRLRAARKAGWTTIEAKIHEANLSPGELLVRQIILDTQRQELTPLEKAKAVDRLMKETGWNASQVASKLGFGNSTVTKLLSLLTLPAELQERVKSGDLAPTAAYELARVNDPAHQTDLAARVASRELTRDGLSGIVKERKRKHPTRKKSSVRVSRFTAKLEDHCSVTVSAPKLDWIAFVTILEELLTRAQSARAEGATLEAFLKRRLAAPAESTLATEPVALQIPGDNSGIARPEELKTAV